MDRRNFVRGAVTLAGAAAAGVFTDVDLANAQQHSESAPPAAITDEERLARIEKARRLMTENGVAAMFLEPGSSMFYYTGVRWGLSERPFGVVIPAKGELAYITPAFEEQRARELIKFSNDVRVWQEDESPYRLVADILRDRGAATGRVGIEERVRFFIADGIRAEAPQAQFVSATPVTAGCRMFKSKAELALMQRANDITIAAYRATFPTMHDGMTQGELSRSIAAAIQRLGGVSDGALVLFGVSSAFPHGTTHPAALKEGDTVLVDGGCTVEGYTSDITRTTVFGKPSQKQRDVWDLEKHAQTAAFNAAQIGATCESVDAAARKVITDAGFGPDYRVPGLPHRTGHGIGLDGHEWTNFVRGNKTLIQPGMCFSDEPTIVIYGEFGCRLEDCLYIGDDGPHFFTQQSPSIEQPFP
ncbi:MAG TPA: Xaa-Pro peptidase family protein [Gemmatimonadaceae bacterium]|nr:Xaa-Pro peptidase family protein [Gemmatimonadaceae bacterium]